MSAVGAHAASVPLTLVDAGSLSNGTQLLRADLTGLGLTQIGSITIVDDGTPVGGAGGIFSGFDLDGIFLDGDGDITTLGDQTYYIGDAWQRRRTGKRRRRTCSRPS
jgi:hypothetical protein